MNDKLSTALSEVDEVYVAHAAKKRRKKKLLLAVAAAVLAAVLVANPPSIPLVISAEAAALAPRSRLGERPDHGSEQWDRWYDHQEQNRAQIKKLLPAVTDFGRNASAQVLSGAENSVWSPVNAYIGLAMTAELTAGQTRQQLLDTLHAPSVAQLRQGISAVWENNDEDTYQNVRVMANSLWLSARIAFRQETVDEIARNYYADVYSGDLGSTRTARDLSRWVKNHTGGLLGGESGSADLSPETLLLLASTLQFEAQWVDKFSRSMTKSGVFHSPDGDRTVPFLNAEEREEQYYWGGEFGAVRLWLTDGNSMWIILPDEDKTVEEILASGEYFTMLTGNRAFFEQHSKRMKVNLALPKFDVRVDTDLKPAMEKLGLSALFEPGSNDFSAGIDTELPVFLTGIRQENRVRIDEDGVRAASYLRIPGAGAAEPVEEIIDFIVDRPFLFAITGEEQIPLFVGCVTHP